MKILILISVLIASGQCSSSENATMERRSISSLLAHLGDLTNLARQGESLSQIQGMGGAVPGLTSEGIPSFPSPFSSYGHSYGYPPSDEYQYEGATPLNSYRDDDTERDRDYDYESSTMTNSNSYKGPTERYTVAHSHRAHPPVFRGYKDAQYHPKGERDEVTTFFPSHGIPDRIIPQQIKLPIFSSHKDPIHLRQENSNSGSFPYGLPLPPIPPEFGGRNNLDDGYRHEAGGYNNDNDDEGNRGRDPSPSPYRNAPERGYTYDLEDGRGFGGLSQTEREAIRAHFEGMVHKGPSPSPSPVTVSAYPNPRLQPQPHPQAGAYLSSSVYGGNPPALPSYGYNPSSGPGAFVGYAPSPPSPTPQQGQSQGHGHGQGPSTAIQDYETQLQLTNAATYHALQQTTGALSGLSPYGMMSQQGAASPLSYDGLAGYGLSSPSSASAGSSLF